MTNADDELDKLLADLDRMVDFQSLDREVKYEQVSSHEIRVVPQQSPIQDLLKLRKQKGQENE